MLLKWIRVAINKTLLGHIMLKLFCQQLHPSPLEVGSFYTYNVTKISGQSSQIPGGMEGVSPSASIPNFSVHY